MSDSSGEVSNEEGRLQRLLPASGMVRSSWMRLAPRLKVRARWLRRQLGSADVAERLEALDESFVEEGAESVTETDLDTVVEQADAIEERFRDNGPLRRLWEDGRLLLALVRDVRHGRYQAVPVWTLSAAVFTLLYVLNPFDVVPEAIPVLGVLDDAAVVSACLALLEQDLYDYRVWRREQAAVDDPETESLPSGERDKTGADEA